MPKYRQIHTKILDSNDVNEMPNDFTRLVWVLLSLILDREGRGVYKLAWIRSRLFPFRDDVEIEQIRDAMEWYIQRKMIIRYAFEDREYFYIPTWHLYQSGTEREAPSSIPAPEQVGSSSGVTPEQVPPKAKQDKTINKPINKARQEEQAPRDPFEEMQAIIERLTGYPALPKDMPAIQEFINKGVTEEDIEGAIAFLAGINKTARGAEQIKGCVFTEFAKRTQSANVSKSNGKSHRSTLIDAAKEYAAEKATKEKTNG